MNKKLAATTILELSVAMLIASVVIIISYNSLEIFNKLNFRFKAVNEKNEQILDLDALLLKDVSNANVVVRTSDGIICKRNFSEIKYSWFDEFIIRDYLQVKDTFKVNSTKPVFLFTGDEVTNSDGLVDEFYFYNKTVEEEDKLHFIKNYAPDIYLNN